MLSSGNRAYFIDSTGQKIEVTISGNSGYSITAKDDYGRTIELPAGRFKPLEAERKDNGEA